MDLKVFVFVVVALTDHFLPVQQWWHVKWFNYLLLVLSEYKSVDSGWQVNISSKRCSGIYLLRLLLVFFDSRGLVWLPCKAQANLLLENVIVEENFLNIYYNKHRSCLSKLDFFLFLFFFLILLTGKSHFCQQSLAGISESNLTGYWHSAAA